MKQLISITKALSDESRLRALMVLRHGDLCVCQIIEILGLAPSTVSKHMTVLREAGLVEGRKEGRWMLYRLPGPQAPRIHRQAVDLILSSLAEAAQTREDDLKLREVLDIDREVLCKRQMGR